MVSCDLYPPSMYRLRTGTTTMTTTTTLTPIITLTASNLIAGSSRPCPLSVLLPLLLLLLLMMLMMMYYSYSYLQSKNYVVVYFCPNSPPSRPTLTPSRISIHTYIQTA